MKLRTLRFCSSFLLLLVFAEGCVLPAGGPKPPRLVLSRNGTAIFVSRPGGNGPFTDVSARIAEPGRSRIEFVDAEGDTTVFQVCAAVGNMSEFGYGSCQLIARSQRTWAEIWRSNPWETAFWGRLDPDGDSLAYVAREQTCMSTACPAADWVIRVQSLKSGSQTAISRSKERLATPYWTGSSQLILEEQTGQLMDETISRVFMVDLVTGKRMEFLHSDAKGEVLNILGIRGVGGDRRIMIVKRVIDTWEVMLYDDRARFLGSAIKYEYPATGYPVWSPDGRYVVWKDVGKLLRVATDPPGSPIETIYDNSAAMPCRPLFDPSSREVIFAAGWCDGQVAGISNVIATGVLTGPFSWRVVTQSVESGLAPVGWIAGDIEWLP